MALIVEKFLSEDVIAIDGIDCGEISNYQVLVESCHS